MWITIILFVLVLVFIRLYLKTHSLKKIRRHFLDIPAFDRGLIDCYVRVSGKIKSENAFSSPISQVACAFYLVKVLALWQTKRKKPAKGMEEQKKVIFQTISPVTQLEVSEGTYYKDTDIIQVDMSEFVKKAKTFLMNETIESRNCPDICQKFSNNKYQSYKILETWCSHNDRIVIYGKLVQTLEGFLKIKPTKLAAYPSFICLEPFEDLPLKKLDKQISKNNIWLIVYLMAIVMTIVAAGIYCLNTPTCFYFINM